MGIINQHVLQLTNTWFSATAEAENGSPIFISGRNDVDKFRTSEKYRERVEIYWNYAPHFNNMPSDIDGELMEKVLVTLQNALERNNFSILTGIYTGDGERTMVFYTRNSRTFQDILNTALQEFEQLPLSLYVENDSAWNEYQEMCEIRPFAE